jgi:hypothetical protein
MRIVCFLERNREKIDTEAHSCLDLYTQIIALLEASFLGCDFAYPFVKHVRGYISRGRR